MSSERTFIGRSGPLAVVVEILARQCNAAIPEVDLGTDLFAFRDENEEIARLQVKTAQAEAYKRGDGHSAQFRIPLDQLDRPDNPPLWYALAVRLDDQFVDYLIIPRPVLHHHATSGVRFGSASDSHLHLTVQFRERVVVGEIDLTAYRNAWGVLPPLAS